MVLKEIEIVKEEDYGICTILHGDTPDSLEIDGSDVTGLPDDYTLAAGSMLITPDKDYIAFEDGVFTEKQSSGGGGGGGSSDFSTATLTIGASAATPYGGMNISHINSLGNASEADIGIGPSASSEVTIILYKGTAIGYVLFDDETPIISTTGAVSYDDEMVIVKGDGGIIFGAN